MTSAGSILGGIVRHMLDHWPAIIVWSAVYLAAIVALTLLVLPLFAGQIVAAEMGAISPAAMAGPLLLLYFGMLVLFVALFAAVFRSVLFPEQRAAAFLRFGMDELRLLGFMIALLIFSFVAFVIFSMVLSIVLGVAMGLSSTSDPRSVGTAGLLIFCFYFAFIAYVGTRISTVGPLTLLRGRIAFSEGLLLTRRRFWTLFGAYFVIGFIILVVSGAIFWITLGPTFEAIARAGSDPNAMRALQAQQQAETFGLSRIATTLLTSIFVAIAIAAQATMMAMATKQLLAEQGEPVG